MFLSAQHKPRSLFAYLTLGYLVVYAVCATLFYVISAHVVSQTQRSFERQDIKSDSLEYAEILRNNTSGNWLAEEVAVENLPASTFFAIRVLDAKGRVVYAASQPSQLNVPGGWEEREGISAQPLPENGWREIYLPAHKRLLQMKTTYLPDGRILQVAKGTTREYAQQVILFRTSLIFFLLASFFTLGIGFWMMSVTLMPIKQITAHMAHIIETSTSEPDVLTINSRISELQTLSMYFILMVRKNATLIKAMKDTLDNVAHDFRTPLARIRSAAEFALNDQKSPPSQEALLAILTGILDDCDTAKIQLQNLMDLRAMESGFIKLQLHRFDLKQTISEIADLYSVLAEDKLLDLCLDLPEDNVWFEGDPARISQVLANLLDNAVKYTPPNGKITLSLRGDLERLRVTLADTGIGIPEEEQSLIWQRLYRSRNARKEKGLGLGLSIVRAIIEAHNGTITVHSSLNCGTTFVVVLPAHSISRPQEPETDR